MDRDDDWVNEPPVVFHTDFASVAFWTPEHWSCDDKGWPWVSPFVREAALDSYQVHFLAALTESLRAGASGPDAPAD